ncbi:betaine--homocysteine S-methyltransferase 1-like [Panulirus ornatus]|uniref:betaine--homocysteine S-methyltransferase 1-like n=1 Tax=Panulirus ornatus TaxID=150431 RepID=UPI003A838A0E
MGKKGLLERLQEGVVIGDGGFVMGLEKRGYVNSATWTPEATVEHPEAVRQMHREFLRAGSDVMQAFTYNGSDDKLALREGSVAKAVSCQEISEAGCRLAREVADEGDALVAGSVSQCLSYSEGKGKAAVQAQIRRLLDVFVKNGVDFILCEMFFHVEELEWAIQEAKQTGLVVAATIAIGELGDLHGVLPGPCAVRMARAGADVVGLNCMFDPDMTMKTMRTMKVALEAEGLRPFLMTQPNGFHCPASGTGGYLACPEFPYAMETRQVTRIDAQKYAREAYDLGVRYIGGCCGFEAYHIRSIAEELAKERGRLPAASDKHLPWGEGLRNYYRPYLRARAGRQYWENLVPSSGRLLPPTHTVDPNFTLRF